jgi:hypothetical protein
MKEHVGGYPTRVARRIFGPDQEEGTGSLSFIIYTLHDMLLPCSNQEILDRWKCRTHHIRYAYKILVRRYEGKRLFERLKFRR